MKKFMNGFCLIALIAALSLFQSSCVPGMCTDFNIYVMNADGSEVTRITELVDGTTYGNVSISPEGDVLFFTREKVVDHYVVECEIYRMDIDGANLTQLTDNSWQERHVGLSPTGNNILYQLNSNNGTSLHVMDYDGIKTINLTEGSWGYFSSWSPDGERIVFISGNHDIYTIKSDGSQRTRITGTSTSGENMPSWSPDGQKIAFLSEVDSSEEILEDNPLDRTTELSVIDGIENGNPRLITSNSSSIMTYNWSPDGTRIAYYYGKRDEDYSYYYGINVVDVYDANETTTIAVSKTQLGTPHWSPDGSKLLYSSLPRYPSGELNLVNSDGTNTRIILDNIYSCSAFWSPDGKKIIARIADAVDPW